MRLTTQVNLPKMKEGKLDVAFLIVYVGQGPLTPEGYDACVPGGHREVRRDPPPRRADRPGDRLALTPSDVRAIARSGRKVAVIGVENGYPIGLDISRVKEFHDRGGRYTSLSRATPQPARRLPHRRARGLEMERRVAARQTGHRRDEPVRHHGRRFTSLEGIDDAGGRALEGADHRLALGGTGALGNVSRNMDDEMLMALKQNGGVIQTVAFSTYLRANPPQRPKLTALQGDCQPSRSVLCGSERI